MYCAASRRSRWSRRHSLPVTETRVEHRIARRAFFLVGNKSSGKALATRDAAVSARCGEQRGFHASPNDPATEQEGVNLAGLAFVLDDRDAY